jgi:hypothetical protein
MKNLGFLFLVFWLFGCQAIENEVPIEDQLQLEKMLEEIISLSESKPCTDSGDWLFTAYGAKACGGPIGYIAYSKKIDQNNFTKLINRYTEAQAAFNRKTGAVSDCMMAARPTKVICENGKPKFEYF